jgi:hypothetical protein
VWEEENRRLCLEMPKNSTLSSAYHIPAKATPQKTGNMLAFFQILYKNTGCLYKQRLTANISDAMTYDQAHRSPRTNPEFD